MSKEYQDNSPAAKSQMAANVIKALTAMGIKNQEIVTKIITEGPGYFRPPVDTGRLRSSMTYQVDEQNEVVIVGSNVEYAPYVHEGTSRMTGRPFLKDSLENYRDDYNEIATKILGDGFGGR